VAVGFVSTSIYVIVAAGLGNVSMIDWGMILYWAQNNDALLLGTWWYPHIEPVGSFCEEPTGNGGWATGTNLRHE